MKKLKIDNVLIFDSKILSILLIKKLHVRFKNFSMCTEELLYVCTYVSFCITYSRVTYATTVNFSLSDLYFQGKQCKILRNVGWRFVQSQE